MNYVRTAAVFAGFVAAFLWGGALAVVALLVAGYVCLVGLILWSIREHGPADPRPLSQLRQRQLEQVCTRQQVKR